MAKFCGDVTAPFCQALFACCTDPQTLTNNGGSEANCEVKFAAACEAQIGVYIKPQITAGNTALDTVRLAACVSTLDAMKAGGNACTRPPRFVMELDCIAAFQGKIAPGAACNSSNLPDIAYIICDKGRCNAGTCMPFLATGAVCDPAGAFSGGCDYPDGEHCALNGGMGTCGPLGKVGDACQTPNQDKSADCYSMSCGPAGNCIAPTAYGICTGG
jgi:hypothetical protein